jgi:hypothetical protein
MKLSPIMAGMAAFAFAGNVMPVKIINRQYHENRYDYVLPGYVRTDGTATATCTGGFCSGSGQSTAIVLPPRPGSITVQGATFSLELPDGRVAVVNCESKFKERFQGPAGNRRSCRMPLINELQVEFSGKDAKLKWPVSLNGKKMESETYRILGVFDKQP